MEGKATVTELSKLSDKQLEARKVIALEEIAKNLEKLYNWTSDFDREEWENRIQWYLSLWKEACLDPKLNNKIL